MKNLLTEFIGTFFLVLTIGLTVLSGTPFAPLAIGSALMAMVYMGGHVSGAHYNPAVSLAVALRGRLPMSQLVPYWISQIVGALLASFVVHLMLGKTFAPAPAPGIGTLQALLGEILFTFALALVVLNVATLRATAGNSYYGLAIGFTVAAGAFSVGPISGGAFNPAVAFGATAGAALFQHGSWSDLWIYLAGPLLGAAIGAGIHVLQARAEPVPPETSVRE